MDSKKDLQQSDATIIMKELSDIKTSMAVNTTETTNIKEVVKESIKETV